MPTYRITGPDGTVYRVTGDGTADDALKHIQSQVGGGAPKAPAAPAELNVDPSAGMTTGEKFLVGAGAATDKAIRGIKGLFGADDTQGAEDAALYQKYHPGGAATMGEIGADIAMTAMPGLKIAQGAQKLSMLPRALANIGGNAAMSAAIAPENRGTAALMGGAGTAAGMGLGYVGGKLLPLATASGRQALKTRKAGEVLVGDLGDEAGNAATQIEQYLANRGGIARDVPLSTAQALRQAEGGAAQPGSAALAKRQLGVSGAAADEFADLARRQNAALHEAATVRAGAEGNPFELAAARQSRENATAPLREGAISEANNEGALLAAPITEHVGEIAARSVPGSPQRGLADLVQRTLTEAPDARKLYELRKLLANKLNGPHMPGDEVAAVVKGADRETMGLINAIDQRLQEASTRGARPPSPGRPGTPDIPAQPASSILDEAGNPLRPATPARPGTAAIQPDPGQAGAEGQWLDYLDTYRNKSLPVTSARAQGQISEALTPEGGALVGDVPEITRHKLKMAMDKFSRSKQFGNDRLTPEARGRYDELQTFMQRNEEAMRSAKLGGTGGGGSQTGMQTGLANEGVPGMVGAGMAMAGYPGAGAAVNVARTVGRVIKGSVKGEVAQMMLDPQRAIAGIRAALAAGQELSPAQLAFRATMSGLGTYAGQPRQ